MKRNASVALVERFFLTVLVVAPSASSFPVLDQAKISQTEGGFSGQMLFSGFGFSATSVGDLDGDGRDELAVGSPWLFDDAEDFETGGVWILFPATFDSLASEQRIQSNVGGFSGLLDQDDFFGASVAALGDLDGDLVPDIAVGSAFDDDGGTDRGAVWILFMNSDGTVRDHTKISQTSGGFGGTLSDDDWFGRSISVIGDLDGDLVVDIAVGHDRADDNGFVNCGAVWILFMNTDGSVRDEARITSSEGWPGNDLGSNNYFGRSVSWLGDLDGNGITEIAVGEPRDSDGNGTPGAVWVLSVGPGGSVVGQQKISTLEGGFLGEIEDSDQFGESCVALPDLDGDGVPELVVGADGDDDGAPQAGAAWLLYLDSDGRAKDYRKISALEGGFTGQLDETDWFGTGLASLGDVSGDGIPDLAVGAPGDDDGGGASGALWLLALADDTVATPPSNDDPQALSGVRPLPADRFVVIQHARTAEEIVVHDAAGRFVVRLPVSRGASASRWDLRDLRGRRVSSGVYFASPSGSSALRMIVR